MSKILIIIDPQNDFVDPKGSLYVKGAEETVKKISDYVRTKGDLYSMIVVTLDSHERTHISLKNGWTHKPEPFTTVVVKNGDVEPTVKDLPMYYYGAGVQIWPDHCIIGTWGHCIPEILEKELSDWGIRNRKNVVYQRKGEYPGYEAFSALTEEFWSEHVIVPGWRKVKADLDFCGFCKDICVAETIKDSVKFGEKSVNLLDSLCATLDPNSKNLEILKEMAKDGEIRITV